MARFYRWHGQNTEAFEIADGCCPTIGAFLGMGGEPEHAAADSGD